MLDKYPTAAKLARARTSALEKIPYVPCERIPELLASARSSVASLTEPTAGELVCDLVRQVKDARIGQKSLKKMLVDAYRRLPANHLDTIPGFGPVTAAILTAKIVDPHRFADPGKLVGLFGVFPVEASSGIDRDGKSRLPVRMVMCKRGNDIVRRYLWGLDRGLTSSTSKPSCRCSVCSSTWGCWTVCAARAPMRKGPCPLHAHNDNSKRDFTFSVNLDQNVFRCFQSSCAREGDVIDLWAVLHGLNCARPPSTWCKSSTSSPHPEQRRGTVKHG